jgi:thioredoxin reductase
MIEYDLVVIGGGISGMTSALVAAEGGVKKILIIEREESLGGILSQCIDSGYGKKLLNMDLTGPEYTNFISDRIMEYSVDTKLKTEVLEVSKERIVTYVNSFEGVSKVKAKAIMLATGCVEKYSGSVSIPVNRFAGIYTIGSVQNIINREGYLPGKEPVIVADNSWAIKVARRLYIEGATIKTLIIDEENGFHLSEQDKKIIEGFNFNILSRCKIKEIFGKERIDGIKIFSEETAKTTILPCDSLILSACYFPDFRIAKTADIEINPENYGPKVNNFQTNIRGIFGCGTLIYGINSLKEDEIDGIEAGKKVVEYLNSI